MECVGFLASFIGVITLVLTRNSALVKTAGGQVAHKFLLVLLAASCEHLFMLASPKKARDRIVKQAVIFKRKHNWIMTWLYIMCFGSFIGYSGSFPKLIVDLFGYIKGDGCITDNLFAVGGDEATCVDAGGVWAEDYDYPNPNMYQRDEKIQQNRYLAEILELCLAEGRLTTEFSSWVPSGHE